MGKADREGGGGGIDGALLAAASPSRCGMEGSGLSEEPSRRGRSGWVRVHKMWVRKPHVGATRGGRSCGSGRGEEDPTELKAESLDPKMPVPLREAGETPASGHLARPPSLPFPSRALGGGDRARSLGRDEAGPVPALAAAAPRALFTPAPGGATAGPARSAPTQGPRRPKWPGGLGRSPSFHFPSWTCGSPALLYAQLCLQPNDACPHPHVRLISPLRRLFTLGVEISLTHLKPSIFSSRIASICPQTLCFFFPCVCQCVSIFVFPSLLHPH